MFLRGAHHNILMLCALIDTLRVSVRQGASPFGNPLKKSTLRRNEVVSWLATIVQ